MPNITMRATGMETRNAFPRKAERGLDESEEELMVRVKRSLDSRDVNVNAV
jgi:hypothetical protein